MYRFRSERHFRRTVHDLLKFVQNDEALGPGPWGQAANWLDVSTSFPPADFARAADRELVMAAARALDRKLALYASARHALEMYKPHPHLCFWQVLR